jgi:DNA-binding NtrC family response regulator
MIQYFIHLVDDEPTIRDSIVASLEEKYRIVAFADAESALEAMAEASPDLVLLDIGLPGMDGVEALGVIKERYPEVLVIMITAYEDLETVIAAMKRGAYDYVVKPLHMDGLEVTIENALETIRLKKEVQLLQEKCLKENFPFFISESQSIQEVVDFIKMVAESPDTPILILGETGTGKEILARVIHFHSPNFKGPLVPVNCAAIPKELIESELFGYEKGAFSGASSTGKKGLIEAAVKGTLFLDEVGDLSLDAQAKLLRFLETGEFYKVGGTKKTRVQARIVSATNKDIEAMMTDGRFRRDLYFRLGVIKVQVPSLNQRPGDILPIAKYFLLKFNQKFNKQINGLAPSVEQALMSRTWTGNVRELKNLIERGVLVARGPRLESTDIGLTETGTRVSLSGGLPSLPDFSPTGIDLTETLQKVEKFYIQRALETSKGNESGAARLLKMNHHTFRYRHKKLFQD